MTEHQQRVLEKMQLLRSHLNSANELLAIVAELAPPCPATLMADLIQTQRYIRSSRNLAEQAHDKLVGEVQKVAIGRGA